MQGLARLGKRIFGKREVRIQPVKTGKGWTSSNLPGSFNPAAVDVSRVRDRALQTSRLGEKPLWSGYREVANYPYSTRGDRTSEQVRTGEDVGAFYAWLAATRLPDVIVEFGTAFGISGMFWLTGLEAAGKGKLMTYEPNRVWADIAEENLRAISDRFTLTKGIFEEHAETTLRRSSVDLAFIDAIHTSDFVYQQYEKLRPFLKNDAIVLFDDIGFSPDMRQCWDDLATRPDVIASFQLEDRVGLVELRLD